jgi:hypothetical protein
VIAIKDSKYYGYGFVDEITDLRTEDLLDLITKYPENKDVRQIIKTYLKTKKNYRIVEF